MSGYVDITYLGYGVGLVIAFWFFGVVVGIIFDLFRRIGFLCVVLGLGLLIPSSGWSTGFQDLTVVCGSDYAGKAVRAKMLLSNSGGSNTFYFESGSDSLTLPLYSSGSTVPVSLNGWADDSGNLEVFISSAQDAAFVAAGVSCDYKDASWVKSLSFVIGGIVGLGFALGSSMRWS